MAISLAKGQKISLTKESTGLRNVRIGLGWDAVKKGFFSRKKDIDCDASVIMLGADGKLKSNEDIVYYGNLCHRSGSIKSQGDNRTGAGEGDDEQILVVLDSVPKEYEKLEFVVTIYEAKERQQNFGLIDNAYIRVVDADKNIEICRFALTDDYSGMTAMIFGEMYRHNNEWKFNAIGQGTWDGSISEMAKRFR